MKVLDVGTGAGDVALLVAGLVGEEGTVIGVDFNAQLVETARSSRSKNPPTRRWRRCHCRAHSC
jgi:ubiquinone/menaquinone biosynthesis C-methylase UbiE